MRKYEITEGRYCGTCDYYCQHYIKWGRGFSALDFGHCTYPRCKYRGPGQVCPNWRERRENP